MVRKNYKMTKILTMIIIVFITFMLMSFTNKVNSSEHKFELYVSAPGQEKITKEYIENNVMGSGEFSNIKLELNIRAIGNEPLPLSGLDINFEQTNYFTKIMSVTTVKEESYLGLMDRWNTVGSSEPISSSSRIVINEQSIFKGAKISSEPTKLVDFNMAVNLSEMPTDFYLDMIFSVAGYEQNTKRYDATDFNLVPITVGNPNAGDNVKINPIVGNISNSFTPISPKLEGDTYNVKKGSNNLTYSDTEGLYIQPSPEAADEVIVKEKNSDVKLKDVGGKFNIENRNVAEYEIIVKTGDKTKKYKLILHVDVAVKDAYIDSLVIQNEGHKISQTFNRNITNYDVTFSHTNTVATFIPKAAIGTTVTQKVNGSTLNSNYTFKDNDVVTLIATPEDPSGTVKVYTFNIKVEEASNDSSLKSISIPGKNYDNPNKNIEFIIPEDQDATFFLDAVRNNTKASVSIKNVNTGTITQGGKVSVSIKKGESISYEITVIAEDTSKSVYFVTITRKKSSNTNISSIFVHENGKQTSLGLDIREYIIKEKNGNFKISVNTSDKTSSWDLFLGSGTVSIKEHGVPISDLQEKNIFRLVVTAPNGETKDYIFDVYKPATENDITDIVLKDFTNTNILAQLDDDDREYQFIKSESGSSTTYSLNMNFKATNQIFLDLVSSNKSTITVIDMTSGTNRSGSGNELKFNYTFTNSNNVGTFRLQFSVSAENGDIKNYIIEITRDKSDNEDRLKEFWINNKIVTNFSPDNFDYGLVYFEPTTLTGQTFDLSIKAITLSSKAYIQVNVDKKPHITKRLNQAEGSYQLERGIKYSIEVIVFAESDTEANQARKTYKIEVILASHNIEISEIYLDQNIQLYENEKDSTIREANVDFTIREVTLNFIYPADANSVISSTTSGISDIRQTWKLNVGKNTRTFKITSESGQKEQSYTVIITRESGRTHKELERLLLRTDAGFENSIDLKKGVYTYYYRVDDKYGNNFNANITLTAFVLDKSGASLDPNKILIEKSENKGVSSGQEVTFTFDVYDENGESVTYTIIVTRANDDNKFVEIEIDNHNNVYQPSEFVKKTDFLMQLITDLEFEYSQSKISFKINLSDLTSKIIIISGSLENNPGTNGIYTWNLTSTTNTLRFKIVSQAGTESPEYEVIVKRKTANKNNDLEFLKIVADDADILNKEFNKPNKGTGYEFIVGRGINDVTIELKILKEYNSIILNFGSYVEFDDYLLYQRTFSGTELDLPIIIEVKAEDVNITNNIHRINIVRMSEENGIENIEIDGIDNNYNFSTDLIRTYTLSVRHGMNPFDIVITKKDSHSQVVINGNQYNNESNKTYIHRLDPNILKDGENIFKFKLRSEYDSKTSKENYSNEYTFIINKKERNSNKNLFQLYVNIDGENVLEGKFNPGALGYSDINVDSSEKTRIAKVIAYVRADYYIQRIEGFIKTGQETLNGIAYDTWTSTVDFGNAKSYEITVPVVAENEEKQTYRVHITRLNDTNEITKVVVSGLPGGNKTFDENDLLNNLIDLGEIPFKTTSLEFHITRSDRNAGLFVDKILKGKQNTLVTYTYIYEFTNTGARSIEFFLKSELELEVNKGITGNIVTFSVDRLEASGDNKIKSIEINNENENLAEGIFKETSYGYAFLLDPKRSNQVDFIIQTNSLSTITFKSSTSENHGNGYFEETINLAEGNNAANKIEIIIKAENGNIQKYTIYIYYALNEYGIDDVKVTEVSNSSNTFTINEGEFDAHGEFTKQVGWDFNSGAMRFSIGLKDPLSKIIVRKNGIVINMDNFELLEGNNTYEIEIISNYGSVVDENYKVDEVKTVSKIYKVIIIKEKANTDTNLLNLKVFNIDEDKYMSFTEDFDPNDSVKRTYTIMLQNIVEKVRIEYEEKDHQIVYPVSSFIDLNEIDLEYIDGNISRTIAIKVDANGTSSTYNIKFSKGENASSNTDVNNVFNIQGKEKTYSYDFDLNNKDNPLIIDSKDDYIRIYNLLVEDVQRLEKDFFENIPAGETYKITLKVIAEDNTVKSYDIYIFREQLSDDNTLKSLTIRYNGKNEYEKTNNDVDDVIDITLVRDAKEITIIAVKNDVNAKGPFISDYKLETGKINVITVTVIAENGDAKNYQINVSLRDTSAEIEIDIKLDNILLKPVITNNITEIIYELGQISFTESLLEIITRLTKSKYVIISGDTGYQDLIIGDNEFIVTSLSEDLESEIIHRIRIEVLPGDENNLLDDLIITSGKDTLKFESGEFDPLINNYQIKLPLNSKISHVNVEAIKSSLSATISGDIGSIILEEVDGVIFKQIRIIVTSEMGIDNIYVVNIIKASTGGSDDDNSVKEIYVRGLITNNKYTYTEGNTNPIIIDRYDTHVQVVVITNSDFATAESPTGSLTFKLEENVRFDAIINVKSQDLTNEKSYIIPMLRESLNDEALLTELQINGDTIFLQDGKFIYEHSVDKEITELVFTWLLSEGAKTNYEMPLVVDFVTGSEITVNISVTSENGLVTNIYTIKIIKDNYEVNITNVILDNVEKISDFNEDNFLKLPERLFKEKRLSVKAISSDADAKVIIDFNGNQFTGIKEVYSELELKEGQNNILIYAESKFGISTKYEITITRKNASNNNELADLKVKHPTDSGIDFEFSPEFKPEINKYVIELSSLKEYINLSSVNIVATKGQDDQIIEGDGIKNLQITNDSSSNPITSETLSVRVIAEDGTINIYEIVIVREIDPEQDVSISEMTTFGNDGIDYLGTNPNALKEFINGKYDYEITVPYELFRLMITIKNDNGAQIVFKNSNNGVFQLTEDITIINFYLVSKGANVGQEHTLIVTKEDPDTDNLLDYLNINGKLITGFQPDKYNYQIMIESEKDIKITIDAGANSPYAIVIGTGEKTVLASKENIYTITVIAQDGSRQDYLITVSSVSNDNEITNIEVDGQQITPEFHQNISSYTLEVPYDISVIEINVEAHPKAKVTGRGYFQLQDGINSIDIFAVSEKGETGKIYNLKVVRKSISDDTTLKNLIVTDANTGTVLGFNQAFNPLTLEYIIIIPKNSPITSINIKAEANNEFATVGGVGFHNLENELEGTEFGNVFSITVRAQNGDTRTYTLKVYKGIEGLDKDNSISDIEVLGSDGKFYLGSRSTENKFSEGRENYEIRVPFSVTSISVRGITKSPLAKMIIKNDLGEDTDVQQFTTNDTITFVVTAMSQEGVISNVTYNILVIRDKPDTSNGIDNIIIDGEEIENFDPENKEYLYEILYDGEVKYVDLDAITITGDDSIISGDTGSQKLNKGVNVFVIIVKNEAEIDDRYVITINHFSNNANLSDLKITGDNDYEYQLIFEKEKNIYDILVRDNETRLTFLGTPEDEDAKVYYPNSDLNDKNEDKFEIMVRAQNGETKLYTIRTKNNLVLSSNTKLKSLFVTGFKIGFDANQLNYMISTKESITELDVEAIAEDPNATVEIIGKDDIRDGRNIVLIKVRAENGDTEIYQITVNREPAQDMLFLMLLILTFFLWLITIVVILFKRQRDKDDNFDTDVIY